MSSDELRGLVLQTQDSAPMGLMAGWAHRRDIALDVADVRGPSLAPADPRRYAFSVLLGSAASLAGETPAWAHRVLTWLRAADAASLPVLGICFGAQALAAALGGSVHRLPAPEIGWFEVETADEDRLPAGPWLEWHEDGLSLPPLAYELAWNDAGTQAFCLRRHLAVQFHPEVTPEIVDGWARAPGSRLPETGRTPEDLAAEFAANADAAAARAERLFDGFAARAGIAPRVAS